MKRQISVLLALTTVASVVSCGGSGTTAETTTAQGETTTAAPVEEVKLPVEKSDFGGAKFNVLAPNNMSVYQQYFFAEEQNGDQMNDAIYNRQIAVEDYLNVDIELIVGGGINEIASTVEKSVLASDDAYQLVLSHGMRNVPEMVTGDLLYDWYEFEDVNLDADYWNQSCNENISFGGKLYYTNSDFMIVSPVSIFFNKDMITDFGLENPYDIVREGTWTLDKMIEMAETASGDLNGDTVYDFNDRYGLTSSNDWEWIGMFYSSGIKTVRKTADGNNFELTLNTPDMYTLVEKIDNLVNKSDTVYMWNYDASAADKLTIATGRTLFQMTGVSSLIGFRSADVDFGIVPLPKLYETQENYETCDWSGLMSSPKTIANPEMVGKVCELLAFHSDDTVTPAYYDVLLGQKLARDADTKEMLDIIFDSIVYDAGMNYFGLSGSMHNLVYTLSRLVIQGGGSDFASYYATHESGSLAQIEAFVEAVVAK